MIKIYFCLLYQQSKNIPFVYFRVTLVALWSVRAVVYGTSLVLCPGEPLTAMSTPLLCILVCPTCAAGSTKQLLITEA